MPDQLIYATPLPRVAQSSRQANRQQRLSERGQVQQDVPDVQSISSQAGAQRITSWARGKYAALTAAEIRELFQQSDLVVPYFAIGDAQTADDGYYRAKTAKPRPQDPRDDRIQRFDVVLTRIGSRRSHWRAVDASVESADNPFGSDSATDIALSAHATDVQWYNTSSGALTDATVQKTATGEHDDFNVYDVSEPSATSPILLYSIPYEWEWRTDARVWDTYDRDRYDATVLSTPTVGSATVGSATVGTERVTKSAWQRVFATDHNFVGRPVIETERLRLEPDEQRGQLAAYRWDATDNAWSAVQLDASDWRLLRWDIRSIDLARVEARATFQDRSSSSTHKVDIAARRGLDEILVQNAPSAGSMPSGLQNRLSPIATDAADDAGERATVIERSEV